MNVLRLKTCDTHIMSCTREAVWRVRVDDLDGSPHVPFNSPSWPYEDAEEHHPLTALRIPVTGAYPSHAYLIAFDRESEVLPTRAEAYQLVAFLDFVREGFNETWKQRLLSRPLDTDAGQNTAIFHKWGTDHWGYRRATHQYGPVFWPGRSESSNSDHRFSLEALLDHIKGVAGETSSRWEEWKSQYPTAFGANTDTSLITVPDQTVAWSYACVRHLHQVSNYLLDGERGKLTVEHLICEEGSRDTLRRYREDV
jgi:hypothetical protein